MHKNKLHIEQFKAVYFLGIGGIGMSAIARYFIQQKYYVAGYDKTPSDLTKELESLGAHISFSEDASEIPRECLNQSDTLIIRTPAVPQSHLGYNFFLDKK